MAFLTISSTDVDVASGGEEEPEMIGTARTAFAKNLISTERGRKRRWKFTTVPIAQATFETLETAVANGAFVNCTGTALSDDTISCKVTITDAGFVMVSGGHLRVLTLRLMEV